MYRKSTHGKRVGVSTALFLAALALFWTAGAPTQASPGPSGEKTETVAADALSCWWKADKSSLHIGEEFTVTLTCRSAETGLEKTVINESLLDPDVLALPPYQVKNGRRYKDLERILPGPDGPVTFHHLQYAYTVTLIGEGFFGKEVPLPPLEIRYHIDLVMNKDAVTPGKERTYLLSALPMRIQSLVPKTASAIRDGGHEAFGDSERRQRNAIVAFVAAGIFLLLPLFVLLPILLRAARGRRKNAFNGSAFSDRDLLRRLAGELHRLEKNCRKASGDEASIGAALWVFRVGCALAVGRRVVQTPVEVETRGREGQLELRKGFWPRTKVLVSASLTPEEMADALAGMNWQEGGKARLKALLDETQGVFAALNNARYAGPGNDAGREMLDGALKRGLMLVRALRRDHCPAVRMARVVADLCAGWGRQWKRS